MDHQRRKEILQPYRDAVLRHGPGFEATLWGSREAQLLRFEIMMKLVDFGGCSILDVGCGHGDFAVDLLARGVPFRRFVGLDALSEVIDAAQARRLARCRFEVRDALTGPGALRVEGEAEPDYVCISGTLNTMDEAAARQLVRDAYDAAAQGVVFNFLSNRAAPKWAGRDLTPARRHDTVRWLDWALGVSCRVGLDHEYMDGHDATMVIRRS